MSGAYAVEQEIRWDYPLHVRSGGRGGATHTLHPDTGKTYCGAPVGRRLTETELNSNAPHCRTCRDQHSHLVNSERFEAWIAHRKQVEKDVPVPLHIQQWEARRAAAAGA